LDKAVIEITCSVKSWNSGRYTVDLAKPRTLIRLSDQSPLEDLLLALEIQSESAAKGEERKDAKK
jgi:hypothetical protein